MPADADADRPATAANVLACSSFDEAQKQYPEVIKYALQDGPPEKVFRDHWSPKAEYHASLRGFIEKSAKSAAAAKAAATKGALPAAPRDPFGTTRPKPAATLDADVVLGCRSFDAAKEKYPQVIKLALRSGPSEDIFRSQWQPSAQYHKSLRSFIAKSVRDVLQAEAEKAAKEEEEDDEKKGRKVTLTRNSDGEFWGFLVSKAMKVLEVQKGTAAEAGGLTKGVYILSVESKWGLVRCLNPTDAYGHVLGMHNPTTITLTVTDIPPTDLPTSEPKKESKKAEKGDETQPYSDVGFTIDGEMPTAPRTTAWMKFSAPKPDTGSADAVVLDYMVRKKDEQRSRTGAAYKPKGTLGQSQAAARHTGIGVVGEAGKGRVAHTGDKVFRKDSQRQVVKDDKGWTLQHGETAEVVDVWRSNDRRNGQLKLRHTDGPTRGSESGWLLADGWRFGSGRDWGLEVLIPEPQESTRRRSRSRGR